MDEIINSTVESTDSEILVHIPESNLVEVNIICRLCANINERIIGIYSEEGISNDLATKMNTYLPVKVSESDTLPLQCCWNCASTVLAWHELVIASIEADRRLRLQINEKQMVSEDEFNCTNEPDPSPVDDRLEPKSPAASLSVFCQDTPITPTRQKHKRKKKKSVLPFNFQQETIDIKKEEWIQCDVITDESLQKYIESIQSPYIEEINKIKDEDIKEDVKTSVEVSVIKNNLTEGYNFSCQYCSLMFVTEDEIINHVKQDHPEKSHDLLDKPLDKKERRKNTKLDYEAVNAVKVVVEGRIYYNCKICGKSLHSPYTYIWHMRIHTGERPFVCDLCGKQFRVSQGLVRHLRETHEGIKNFGCDICGRMFATRRNVEEHRRIHTNERPYICDLCGKSFKQKASLFVHNRSHNDSFPFRCSYCNQGFRTRPPLLIHVTRHTGEKPYPCDICGRCFRIKYELKRHKLIHSEEKPFSCSVCGLSFRQKRYLRNHNKINHDRNTP